jgi:hypothetical protein
LPGRLFDQAVGEINAALLTEVDIDQGDVGSKLLIAVERLAGR